MGKGSHNRPHCTHDKRTLRFAQSRSGNMGPMGPQGGPWGPWGPRGPKGPMPPGGFLGPFEAPRAPPEALGDSAGAPEAPGHFWNFPNFFGFLPRNPESGHRPLRTATETLRLAMEPLRLATEPSGLATEPSGLATEPSGLATEPSGVAPEPSGQPRRPGHGPGHPASQLLLQLLLVLPGQKRLTATEKRLRRQRRPLLFF